MSLLVRDFFPGQLFGSHVGGSAAANFVAADIVGDPGETEVGDHNLAAPVEHNVGRFQIAVQYALGVSRGESGTKLSRNVERLVGRKTADAPQQGSEVFAIDVLHGEESLAIDVADIVDAAYIGMRDTTRDPHFIAKAFEQAFIAGRLIGQKLQRNGLSESEIVSAINLAHAAFAQQCDDAVPRCHQPARKEASFVQEVFGGTRRTGGRFRNGAGWQR